MSEDEERESMCVELLDMCLSGSHAFNREKLVPLVLLELLEPVVLPYVSLWLYNISFRTDATNKCFFPAVENRWSVF